MKSIILLINIELSFFNENINFFSHERWFSIVYVSLDKIYRYAILDDFSGTRKEMIKEIFTNLFLLCHKDIQYPITYKSCDIKSSHFHFEALCNYFQKNTNYPTLRDSIKVKIKDGKRELFLFLTSKKKKRSGKKKITNIFLF